MSLCRSLDIIDLRTAAILLGISSRTLAKYANAGEIPCRKVGRKFLFSRIALSEWLYKMDTVKSSVKAIPGKEIE